MHGSTFCSRAARAAGRQSHRCHKQWEMLFGQRLSAVLLLDCFRCLLALLPARCRTPIQPGFGPLLSSSVLGLVYKYTNTGITVFQYNKITIPQYTFIPLHGTFYWRWKMERGLERCLLCVRLTYWTPTKRQYIRVIIHYDSNGVL